MRLRPVAALPRIVLFAFVAGCGAARAAIVDEPTPATDDDPPTWSPPAAREGQTGEPLALTLTGGAEQARALLVALVLAIRDGNESAIGALLAERVSHVQSGLARTTWTRPALARQILAGAAASHVEPDAPFDTLVDPVTIQVGDVGAQLEGPYGPGIEPGDQAVVFTPTPAGRRLLAGLGSTTLVVRPGPTPLLVAR